MDQQTLRSFHRRLPLAVFAPALIFAVFVAHIAAQIAAEQRAGEDTYLAGLAVLWGLPLVPVVLVVALCAIPGLGIDSQLGARRLSTWLVTLMLGGCASWLVLGGVLHRAL